MNQIQNFQKFMSSSKNSKSIPKKSGAICSNKTSYSSHDLMLPKIAYLHPKLPLPFRQKMQIFSLKIRIERDLKKFVGSSSKNVWRPFLYQKGVVASSHHFFCGRSSKKLQKSVKILHFSHFGDNFQQIYNCSSMCLITAASLSSKIQN